MNLTYPGLRLLHRDTNLRIADKYRPGMLLHQQEPTDATLLDGGMESSHRYAILSNHFLDPSDLNFGAEWALCTIDSGAHFKVLDIYRRLGKTQITLLHLPDAHWRVFEDVSTNVDDLLIDYTRKRFDECLEAPPLDALQDPGWHKRCVRPVGMTDMGVLLPLE
ncbi:hypothetical protein LJC33_02020 [Eubacteriales bacterium OttesenSCG-928-N13]|nr:hypothetical protein [Eubacteriales bacterium OttesenSCG-928-N13]